MRVEGRERGKQVVCVALSVILSVLGASWVKAGEPKGVLPQILGPAVYYGALSGGDWVLSHQAMRKGYSEANPVIRRVGFGPAKLGGALLMVGGDYALRKHKRAQWGLRVLTGAFYGYAMVRAGRAK
jgi:hypothetical protein